MFFNNGIHEKQVEKSFDHPSGFVHLILRTIFLHFSKLPFQKGRELMDKHKSTILSLFLKANALLVKPAKLLSVFSIVAMHLLASC
jgi:hypothetical protein